MDDLRPPEDEVYVQIHWAGPYFVGKDRQIRPSEEAQLGGEPVPKHPGRGVYFVLADHHVYGSRALVYIGRSEEIEARVGGHSKWLIDEWRPEVYIGEVKSEKDIVLDQLERLLVAAHSPPYNASGVGGARGIDPPLRIWNTGSFFRLLPEVSSGHPWC